MNIFQSHAVIPGATRAMDDNYHQLKDNRGRPVWNMPRHSRLAPHWASAGMRRKAEAAGKDIMTAGIPYVVMIPIYRGVRNDNFRYGRRSQLYGRRLAARKEMSDNEKVRLTAEKMGAPEFPDLGGL